MTNYNIIGGDGRQYGPITANEVRKWVAQGRLNGKSLVQPEGAAEWSPLENLSEFAEVFGMAASEVPPALPVNPEEYSKHILERAPDLRLGECLSAGFRFFSANAGFVIGVVLVSYLLIGAMRLVPIIGGIVSLILSGVVMGGLYLTCIRRMRGEAVGVGNIFDGFKLSFVQLMLTGAISQLLTQLGLVFCLLPGVYFFIAWTFALPLVADKRLEFWSAMELSRKVATRVWFQLFLLRLLIFLPFLIVSGLFAAKIALVAYDALKGANYDMTQWLPSLWERRFEIIKSSLMLGILSQILYIACQCFGVGAIVRAYENLFGQQPR